MGRASGLHGELHKLAGDDRLPLTLSLLTTPIVSNRYPQGITPEARFWASVDRLGTDDCWHWSAWINRTGYGVFRIGNAQYRASHVALVLAGHPIPFDGAQALHSCDVRVCCNAAHLRWGTNEENVEDAKQRFRHLHGERSNLSRLTETQVIEIHRQYAAGRPGWLIADDFGVSTDQVRKIAAGQDWRYLCLPPLPPQKPVRRAFALAQWGQE